MTAFQKLCVELPPPKHPFAATGDWSHVERDLGLILPSDYRTFISTFGTGKVCGFVWVHSPFTCTDNASLVPFVSRTVSVYQSYVDTKVLGEIPYPVYPEKGGLLPFGTTENANYLNWLTIGPPEEWEIIVWDLDSLDFFDTGYSSLTEFMADLVQQKCGLVPNDPPLDWFDPPRVFTSVDFDSAI